jgi:cytochrome c oxidase assembly protein subunit 15
MGKAVGFGLPFSAVWHLDQLQASAQADMVRAKCNQRFRSPMPTAAYTLHDSRAIRLWLVAVAALIFLMVLVGGATRLTESGLSIVEWKPVTGALPPLNEADWRAEFKNYQAVPQYRELNRGMSLAEFKTIYWWEWTHRQLGRLIGAAFLLPFLWFLWRGRVGPGLRSRLWLIFALGAVQGAVGWWMVSSGLADRVNVSQYRLAFHLALACIIFAAIVWTAQRMRPLPAIAAPVRIRAGAAVLLVLVLGQIYLGALVAGLRAGLVYNTWPLIDGAWLPSASSLFFTEPLWRNFFENALMVQFVHRTVAYLLVICAILHVVDVTRTFRGQPALDGALALASAVTIQAGLGILTLIYHVPISLALLHQGMAMVVLTIAVVHLERLTASTVAHAKSRTVERVAKSVIAPGRN